MITLDHAGLAGPDLQALHAQYAALGFTLTPLARQSGRLRADGPVVPWGTANRCAMLQGGYIEMLGICDPAAPPNGLDTFLARYAGLHILAFAVDDEAAALARLRRAGVDIAGVLHLVRPVDSADPDGPQARFARLPLPNAPEGRIQLIRHLTPEAIWQERFMAHANRAAALETVLLAVADPAETAARFSTLAGVPVLPDPAGGFTLALSRGQVRILTAEALATVLPGVAPPVLPFMAGMVVRTQDGAVAARRIAPLQAVPDGWMAPPAMAGGPRLSSADTGDVAIVLPPKEGFSPGAVGAIGLLVHRLVRAGAGGVVLGGPTAALPFADVRFQAVRLGWGFSRAARYAGGVAAAVRALRPRLVEVHNWPEVALRLVRTGVPVTLILNNDPQTMRGSRTAAERGALLQALAGVATSSAWLRARLLDGVAAPARDPVVLHNCIDVPPPPPTARDAVILFAGRMVRDKGADSFVAACALALPGLPGWRAEMIGADRFRPDSPETPFLRSLRPRAEAAGIVLHGHQPNTVVLQAMRRAAVVAVPSRWAEPFGLVAVEAMAHGAALVCSDRGGLPEVAGDTALYADPDDARALADSILALARDPARRTAMAAAGRARAETFGAPAAAARLLAFRASALATS